jgi:hypothetical protein
MPVDAFEYRLMEPLRFDEKKIRLPSLENTGFKSMAGSNVRRVASPRSASKSQMSPFRVRGSRRPMASRFPPGARAGFV